MNLGRILILMMKLNFVLIKPVFSDWRDMKLLRPQMEKTALQKLEQTQVDVILCDVKLPDLMEWN